MTNVFDDLDRRAEMFQLRRYGKGIAWLAKRYKANIKEVQVCCTTNKVFIENSNKSKIPKYIQIKIDDIIVKSPYSNRCPQDKYVHLIDEKRNQGKNYSDYLKERGIVLK